MEVVRSHWPPVFVKAPKKEMPARGTGVEYDLGGEGSQRFIGFFGLVFSCALGIGAVIRLMRFCRCYRWHLSTILSNDFGRKRFAIHLLILSGVFFVIPMYTMLLVRGSLCTGLLALQRLQFLCIFAALGLVLSDWRIDVYEAPLLQAKRMLLYQLRDHVTAAILVVSFLLNVCGPFFCLEPGWGALRGYTGHGSRESEVIDAAYLVQLLCGLLMMISMLYSGLQMKTRLVWASRSPLRQNDLFRTALYQLNIILLVCVSSFVCQLVTLIFNYAVLVYYQHTFFPAVVLWGVGVWYPSLGWSASCMYLARKARRQSFTTGQAPHQLTTNQQEYVQVLLNDGEDDEVLVGAPSASHQQQPHDGDPVESLLAGQQQHLEGDSSQQLGHLLDSEEDALLLGQEGEHKTRI